VPPATDAGGETTPPTLSQLPVVGTNPSAPAQTPDNSESPMKLWYILAPAAVLILLLLLLLRKRKKKDGN
jgi:hypothetical protein